MGPEFQVELWRRQRDRDPGRHLGELANALADLGDPGADDDRKLRAIGLAGAALINFCSAHSIPFWPILRGPSAGRLTKDDASRLMAPDPDRDAIARLAHQLRWRAATMGAEFETLVPLVASGGSGK